MSDSVSKETLGFQTEVSQLLKLMIHSLYSNKEIFLRELISNASDACDKLRFEALTDASLMGDDSDLKIDISVDREKRTVSISDNGIGMSRDEVVQNIGTIAKSGTKEFFNKLTGDQAQDATLIGQFGVGFYSSFIVADKVTLISRRAGLPESEAVCWESAGEGDFTVETVSKPSRGTQIILHLRADEDDLLEGYRLKTIAQRYSDHINLPIFMPKEEWNEKESKYVLQDESDQINQASAIWARPKSEVTDEQYQDFYKHISHDMEKPLAWAHARVEGKSEYTQLLYVPSKAPYDLWNREHKRGLKLYVRRVFIMEDAEQLLPGYLRFVKGVVDSADLPLNVSREILQESRDVEAIRKGCVNRVLGMIEDMAENQHDKFAVFWTEFGSVLKEGVGEDWSNKERIAKLLRFSSTADSGDKQVVALNDYVGRMKEGQDKIYYITAETHAAAKSSPHLEIFKKKDIEVLLLSDRVDEWAVSNLQEFDGKKLVSVAKGALDLGSIDNAADSEEEKDSADSSDLINRIKESLAGKVKDVRVSSRLVDSPSCLVSDEDEMSMNLSRMLKAAGQEVPAVEPILEINVNHPIVKKMADEKDKDRFSDWSSIVLDQAMLADGGTLEDPATFVVKLNNLILDLSQNT
ncbi:MAG TPA: molecular chaperone HtpG [Betaproteobacteria bacterium]|jgi:molecular chaperone HtpG|nr:molecular chaperone HtpG [Betaproteobacteria bacterium]HAT51989.1 molecular chaperone HtpG [Betaproteobacteria bacterium]HAU82534.1 molecular chaperone HtpG [Betaproteobacteria bacterium]